MKGPVTLGGVKVPSGAELPMPEAPADPNAKVDDLDQLAF